MVAVTSTRSRIALLVAAAVIGALPQAAPVAAGGEGDVHEPPYEKGPQGGDEFNHIEADRQTGEMTVLRLFPGVPPVVGCAPEPSAGWAMFRVPHRVSGSASDVVLRFDAMLDPYSWVSLGARTPGGEWLGVEKLQGPHQGAEKLKLHLLTRPRPGSEIVIEFGLQLGDACPQAGGAHATFSSVTVKG